jgi:pilus assembly protein FimV
LTKALEATLADEQPATVELSVEEPAAVAVGDEDRHIHLAALGALLPGIVRTASREQAAESTRVIEALNDIGLSAEHQSLLQMLQSVISLLARLPARDGAATENLVNYIYEQLLQESCPPEALTTAVQRFTTWLQDATALMPQVPTTADATEESPNSLTLLRNCILNSSNCGPISKRSSPNSATKCTTTKAEHPMSTRQGGHVTDVPILPPCG